MLSRSVTPLLLPVPLQEPPQNHRSSRPSPISMEGVGSRLGRASSRYGTTTVFNGPVRKWKKKWVHVSSSSSSTISSSHNSNSNSQSQGSRLLLCRWTPISSAADDTNPSAPEPPPKRKFQYTPIAVLEEQKKVVAKKADEEAKASETDHSIVTSSTKSSESHGRPDCNEVVKEETKDANTRPLDLSFGFEDHSGNMDSATASQNNEGQLKSKATGAFWSVN